MPELDRPAAGAPEPLDRFPLIGRSAPLLAALDQLGKIADCDATTLLQGETGTGKELAARAIHYLGARRGKPFVPVNCGALPDHLIANELFGHARGAFTDARQDQRGLIADAHGGTLFLDEVETLSPQAQVSLLRFLQDRTYRPLGGRTDLVADVRVVTATNVDLRALVRAGRFRADLLYRIDVMNLALPPLRARGHDVILLANYFLERFGHQAGRAPPMLGPESMAALLAHDWPGNVRELENLMQRAFVLAEHGVAYPERFLPGAGPAPLATVGAPSHEPPSQLSGQRFASAKAAVVQAFERAFVSRAMVECQGNVTAAAHRCGKERRTFGKLLKKLGIDRRAYAPDPSKP